jgi:hypothetical protein
MAPVAPAPTTELGYAVPSWAAISGATSSGYLAWGAGTDPYEETPELAWPYGVRVFDRMRRTDGQVRGTYWAVTLPMRRPGIFALDPDQAREEVVTQVADDLDLPVMGMDRRRPPRRRGRFSWAEHLRLTTLDLIYGHMVFEIVCVVADGRVRLRKLAPRFPQTLAAINVAADGGLVSVSQWAMARSNEQVTLPIERLVVYVNDREGATWTGASILRPVYKHWLLKDRGMRTQAMSLERTGMGVPVITAPERATPAQVQELDTMAQNYRAGESAGGALPYGATLELVGIKGTVPDALPAITYHDNSIARSMLAQFLQLGTDGNTGNRALVGGFLDFFATAVDGICARYADTTTQHVVEDLVDWNWGPDEPAPKIVTRPIDAERDIDPASLVALIQAGAISMDDQLENWLRARYSLPARLEAGHRDRGAAA